MKKSFLVILFGLLLIATGALADTPIPNNGSWIVLDEVMTAPAFFSGGPWTWNGTGTFYITDLYVVTDIFKVYDNGGLVLTTPNLPDWYLVASPPYTGDPDIAWAAAEYSKGTYTMGIGSHSITIEDIHIPLISPNGTPYIDGTVAFKATPEPFSMLLLGSGLVGLAGLGRKKFFKKG